MDRMTRRIDWLFAAVLVALSLVAYGSLAGEAHADTGPKPSMEFEFHFDGEPVPIVDGQLLICDNDDCSRSHPLEELGPQQFRCSSTRCWSDAYGYGSRLKLVVDFEDRTRESNVFRKDAFNARYSVQVRRSTLEVTEIEHVFNEDFVPALAVTLIVETIAAALITLTLRPRRLVLFLIPLASLITLPAAWFVFPAIGLYDFVTVLLAEVFIVWFEALVLRLAVRRRMTPELALAYSLAINLASFVVGLFVI